MRASTEGLETVETLRGARNARAGAAGEQSALRACLARGWELLDQRWRGGGGEIDLIFRDGVTFVFVEVKTSENFDAALARITRPQVARIYRAAEAWLAGRPEGAFADLRFDVALVNGVGEVEILEGALLLD